MMKATYLFLLLILVNSISFVSAAPRSYGSIAVGFEAISYGEDISIFGKQLEQDTLIINPVQHSQTYTAFDDRRYGLYIDSTSTLFEYMNEENWDLAPYGKIQSNDMTLSTVDVSIEGAYQFAYRSQFTAGFSFFVLDFTRSNLKRESGGDALHQDIINGVYDDLIREAAPNDDAADSLVNAVDCEADGPGDNNLDGEKGFCMTRGAISENQSSIEFLLGYLYDSNLGLSRKYSFYWNVQLALPVWHRTVNSSFGNEAFSNYGGGWGINATAGLRWSLSERINFTIASHLSHKRRDAVTKTVNDQRVSVPNIHYSNVQLVAGILWYL